MVVVPAVEDGPAVEVGEVGEDGEDGGVGVANRSLTLHLFVAQHIPTQEMILTPKPGALALASSQILASAVEQLTTDGSETLF